MQLANESFLGNVELKFAMCDTDAQLERCVNLFLAPVLLKVASPHEQVRKKVASFSWPLLDSGLPFVHAIRF